MYPSYLRCPACGKELDDSSFDYDGNRHWLSDCRPDLVEHEIGEACTWSSVPDAPYGRNCYAYIDERRQVTPDHVHFYPDGPMVI